MIVQSDMIKVNLQYEYTAYKEFVRRLTVARGSCNIARLLLAIDSCSFNTFEVGLIEKYFAAGAKVAVPLADYAAQLGITTVRARKISRDISQKVFSAYDLMGFADDRFCDLTILELQKLCFTSRLADIIPLVYLPLSSFMKTSEYLNDAYLGEYISGSVAVLRLFELSNDYANRVLSEVSQWLSAHDIDSRYVLRINSEYGISSSLGNCSLCYFPLRDSTLHRLYKAGYRKVNDVIPLLNCVSSVTTPEMLITQEVFGLGSTSANACARDLWQVLVRVLSEMHFKLVRLEFDRWEIRKL